MRLVTFMSGISQSLLIVCFASDDFPSLLILLHWYYFMCLTLSAFQQASPSPLSMFCRVGIPNSPPLRVLLFQYILLFTNYFLLFRFTIAFPLAQRFVVTTSQTLLLEQSASMFEHVHLLSPMERGKAHDVSPIQKHQPTTVKHFPVLFWCPRGALDPTTFTFVPVACMISVACP